MNFKKNSKQQQDFRKKVISGLKESVKELNELYEEALAEYEEFEAAAEELKLLADELYKELEDTTQQKMKNILLHYNKAGILAKNNVRDIRDVLRNQKKRLKELQNEM